MPKLSEIIFGSKPKTEHLSTLNPQQQQLQNQLIQMLGPLLQQGGGFLESLFGGGQGGDQFAASYKRQFEEQTIPGIAERFSEADAQNSSAFGQQLGAAGAGLQENLASLQGQLSQQGLQALMQLLSQGQQPTFNTMYQPGGGGAFPELMRGLGGAIPGAFSGNPLQALMGSSNAMSGAGAGGNAGGAGSKYSFGPQTSGMHNLPNFMGGL